MSKVTENQNVQTVATLKKMGIAELRKLAGTTDKKLNKSQLIDVIRGEEELPSTTNTETAPPETAKEETVTEDTKPKLELIKLAEQGQVGDVIRYQSSKKPYLVASVGEEGVLLVSATQQYLSTKKEFEVVRISKGEGALPTTFETSPSDKIEVGTLNTCLEIANEKLAERATKKLAQDAAAKKKEEAAAAKVAEVAEVVPTDAADVK